MGAMRVAATQAQSDQLSAISFLFTSTFLSLWEGTFPIYRKMNFPVHFALKSIGNGLKYLYNQLTYFLKASKDVPFLVLLIWAL